jgi:hypothetical protein
MEVVLQVRSFDAALYESLKATATPAAKSVGENLAKSEKARTSLEDLFEE